MSPQSTQTAINGQLPPLYVVPKQEQKIKKKKKKENTTLLSFLPTVINHKAQLTRLQTSFFDLPAGERAGEGFPPRGNEHREIKGSKFSFLLSETRTVRRSYFREIDDSDRGLANASVSSGQYRETRASELTFVTLLRLRVITSTPVTRECLSTVHRLFTRERRGPLRSHIPAYRSQFASTGLTNLAKFETVKENWRFSDGEVKKKKKKRECYDIHDTSY